LLNQRGGARASLNPGAVGRGSSMTPEEREAMVAKLKSQKRATVGSSGAALTRSKSANGMAQASGAEDKRAALKKRLESFNKLKNDDSAVNEGEAAPVEEEQQPKPTLLKKTQTEKVLPLRRDALLDKESSDEEVVVKKKTPVAEYSVGDVLEALYLEDSFWYAAKVEQVHDNNTYTIVFTEYGNQQVCQPSEVRKKKDEKVNKTCFCHICLCIKMCVHRLSAWRKSRIVNSLRRKRLRRACRQKRRAAQRARGGAARRRLAWCPREQKHPRPRETEKKHTEELLHR
jgi:hypothetical protein